MMGLVYICAAKTLPGLNHADASSVRPRERERKSSQFQDFDQAKYARSKKGTNITSS